jgi:hypothetical protein
MMLQMIQNERCRKDRGGGGRKEDAGKLLPVSLVFRVLKLLPVILVFRASNTDSDLQLAKTEVSPVENSKRHQWAWSEKEGCGNVLTGYSSVLYINLLNRLEICQDRNLTCGTFAEASSADCPAKVQYGNVLK